MLESEFSGKSAVIWPHHSKNIPEKVPMFQISYLPIEFIYEKNMEKIGIEFLTQYADKPRIYKNGIALAIPDKNQIEPLRRAIRYLIAVERVKGKNKSLNLTEEQLEQLKEREKTEKSSRDSSFRNLYNTVWLLKIEDGKPTLDVIEVGGRALQSTNIHERLMELLMRVPPPKVFDSLTAKRVLDLIKFEEGVETKDIIDTFFSSPDFPRIIDENVIKKAISKGIKDNLFGITNKDKVQIVKDKPVVAKEQVTIGKEIPLEEIDLSSDYIVSSKNIPIERETEVRQIPEEEIKEPKIPEVGKITQIRYCLKVNRQQLFKCFNALGNLAEKSGELSLMIEAQTKEGIDANWLKNAVEEPIEEVGVEIKKRG